jgi:cytochrome P450
MGFISLTKLAYSLIAFVVAYRLYWEVTTGARRRAQAKQHGTQPPKRLPAKDPFLGLDSLWANLQTIKEHRVLQWFQENLTKNDAHTVSWHILWSNIIITDDPENVKTLLATNFDAWSIGAGRIKELSSFLGFGIFVNEGAAWKHSRSMLRPFFERSHIADISFMQKHVDVFVKLLPTDGTTIDLQPLFHQLTLDIASEFLFGRSTNSLEQGNEDKDCKTFVEAFEYCTDPFPDDNASSLWMMMKSFLPDRKFNESVKTMQAFADTIIDKAFAQKASEGEENSSGHRVFLDEVISQTSERSVIRAELLNLLLAGHDTTASLLSNILWEIPRHPHVIKRLQYEIAEHIGSAVPSYEHLKNMKYLKAVINESQRLYPVVPFNSREALVDTVIPHGGGADGTAPVLIPKGSLIIFLPYAMHRRPDFYGSDALEFNPERWLDDEHPLRPGWSYLPFGGGPRICIGQNFALTEAMFVVVRLLQSLDFESRDSMPWREKLHFTCTGFGGCKVALKERI